ncbi:hypothetical protein [Chitinophaga caseinilytica]|uniref:Lipocalin-like domain-containing protein n=1 Tax=Chitinophaga caseinilytica TaxID=2267521 RepID=A0ABZ2YZL4_9BACT
MKKISSLTYLLFAALVFTGCSKKDDEPKPTGTLNGTYQFVSMYLKAKTEQSYVEAGVTNRTVSDIEYTTTENTGMMIIEGNTMTSTGLGYKINATMIVESFTGTTPDFDEPFQVPFNFTVPKYNSTATFKYVGTDSVLAEKGLIQFPSTGQEMPVVPNASKFAIVNGELIFTSVINQSSSEVIQGVRMQKIQTGLAIGRFKKM